MGGSRITALYHDATMLPNSTDLHVQVAVDVDDGGAALCQEVAHELVKQILVYSTSNRHVHGADGLVLLEAQPWQGWLAGQGGQLGCPKSGLCCLYLQALGMFGSMEQIGTQGS